MGSLLFSGVVAAEDYGVGSYPYAHQLCWPLRYQEQPSRAHFPVW